MPPRYSEADMQNALAKVMSGGPVHRAARRWDIPSTTLLYRSRGSTTRAAVSEGRQKLTRTQEAHLSNWIVSQAALGFPINQAGVYDFVKKVLEKSGGKDRTLGRQWVGCFLRRHPGITNVKGMLYPTADMTPDPAEVAVLALQRQASAEQSAKSEHRELGPEEWNGLNGTDGPGVDGPEVNEPRQSPARPASPPIPPQAESHQRPQEPCFVLIRDTTPIETRSAMEEDQTPSQREASTEYPTPFQLEAAVEDTHLIHPGAVPPNAPLSI